VVNGAQKLKGVVGKNNHFYKVKSRSDAKFFYSLDWCTWSTVTASSTLPLSDSWDSNM